MFNNAPTRTVKWASREEARHAVTRCLLRREGPGGTGGERFWIPAFSWIWGGGRSHSHFSSHARSTSEQQSEDAGGRCPRPRRHTDEPPPDVHDFGLKCY